MLQENCAPSLLFNGTLKILHQGLKLTKQKFTTFPPSPATNYLIRSVLILGIKYHRYLLLVRFWEFSFTFSGWCWGEPNIKKVIDFFALPATNSLIRNVLIRGIKYHRYLLSLCFIHVCFFTFLGWFWGDPHIKTLDDRSYTFNGLGEFVMVDANEGQFQLQARTKRAQGNNTKATIFSAGAAKEENTSIIEIRVKPKGKDTVMHFT